MADSPSSTDGAGRVAEALERLDEDALAAATDALREWLTHADEHDYGATARWIVASYLAAEVVPRERTRVLEEIIEKAIDQITEGFDAKWPSGKKPRDDRGWIEFAMALDTLRDAQRPPRPSLAAVAVEDDGKSVIPNPIDRLPPRSVPNTRHICAAVLMRNERRPQAPRRRSRP